MKTHFMYIYYIFYYFKVCNHPELFERRDAKSSMFCPAHVYYMPYLIYNLNIRMKYYKVNNRYFAFTPEYIAHALASNYGGSIFNFCIALRLSVGEVYNIFQGNILAR